MQPYQYINVDGLEDRDCEIGLKKQDSTICIYKKYTSNIKTENVWKYRRGGGGEWSGVEEICHTNTKHQKACVTMLSDKVDFKTKSISRGKEGDWIVINWPLYQDITILK